MAAVSPHPFAVACRSKWSTLERFPIPKSYNPRWRPQSVKISSSDCVGEVI